MAGVATAGVVVLLQRRAQRALPAAPFRRRAGARLNRARLLLAPDPGLTLSERATLSQPSDSSPLRARTNVLIASQTAESTQRRRSPRGPEPNIPRTVEPERCSTQAAAMHQRSYSIKVAARSRLAWRLRSRGGNHPARRARVGDQRRCLRLATVSWIVSPCARGGSGA